jgi:hypothetical protein
MTTACLLHFDGDVATMVRWIGGPHVNAHLNVATILATLQPIPDIYSDVKRILTFGAPAVCNAEASESNFQAYLTYGNHQSVTQNQSVFESTIVKQTEQARTYLDNGPTNDPFRPECPSVSPRSCRCYPQTSQTTTSVRQ